MDSAHGRKSVLILTILTFEYFAFSASAAVQYPLYPRVADSKGVTITEYGSMFAIYYLMRFVFSPVFGRYMHVIGPRRMINLGVLAVGCSSLSCGLLIYANKTWFIGLSFLLRIIEGTGNACFLTAAYTVGAEEFPGKIGVAVSMIQSASPAGRIMGPILGGLLYTVGGFSVPFYVLGTFLLLANLGSFLLITKEYKVDSPQNHSTVLKEILKSPEVTVAMITVTATMICYTFLLVGLESYLRSLKMSQLVISFMFAVIAIPQSISCPIAGKLCDRNVSPKSLIIFGASLNIVALVFVGPVDFPKNDVLIWVTGSALALFGLAVGVEHSASLIGAQKDAAKLGLTDELTTSGLISGIWNSGYALGAFIGSVIAGPMIDSFGFKESSILGVILQIFLLVNMVSLILYRKIVPFRPVDFVELK